MSLIVSYDTYVNYIVRKITIIYKTFKSNIMNGFKMKK